MGGSRPAAALAVFLVSVLLFGGVAGLARAEDGPSVEAFRTVAPEHGEKGLYHATFEGSWATTEKGAGPMPFLAFEWRGDQVVRDGEGRQRVVNVVDITAHSYQPAFADNAAKWMVHQWEGRFDPETGWAADLVFGQGWSNEMDVFRSGINLTSDGAYELRLPGFPDMPGCMFRHPWQPGVRELRGVGTCIVPGIDAFGTIETGIQAVGLVDDPDFGRVLHVHGERVDLWYSPQVSVPVRYEVRSHDFDQDGVPDQGVARAYLTQYERGSGALDHVPVVDPDPLSPVGSVARDRRGPDDAGLMELPLRDVLAAAQTWPPFEEWTTAHPDWAVFLASASMLEAHGAEALTWSVQLADGDAVFGFEAQRPRSLLGVPVPGQEVAFSEHQLPLEAPPEAWAPFMPDLDAAFGWHDAFMGEAPTVWSWDARCGSTGLALLLAGGCGASVFVGHDRTTVDVVVLASPVEDGGVASDWSGLFFAEGGGLGAVANVAQDVGAEPEAFKMVAGDPPVDDEQDEAGSISVFWSPPSVEQAAGAGLLALLAASVYYFWPSLKTLPLVGGFSRLRKDELEEHPARAAIMEVVRAEPGVHFQEIRRRSDLAVGTARHHVAQLEAQGRLVKRKANGYACFFAGSVSRSDTATAPLLRSPGARKVLDAVRDWPGATNKDIAGVTGLSPATVSYHLKRLGAAGVVTTQRTADGLQVQAA